VILLTLDERAETSGYGGGETPLQSTPAPVMTPSGCRLQFRLQIVLVSWEEACNGKVKSSIRWYARNDARLISPANYISVKSAIR
jgi:hypothetical protein